MEEEVDGQLMEKAFIKLTQGTYPEGSTKNEKRVITKKASTLDVLHYKKKDGKRVSLEVQYSRTSELWTSESSVKQALKISAY